jgi:hypothetical protein
MPAGIAGDVSRKELAKIEPGIMDPLYPVTLFGVPVKKVSGKFRPITTGDVASDVYGLSVRPFPMQTSINEALAAGTPSTDQPLDTLVSGYMTVKNNAGVPAEGNPVYMRVVASGVAAQPLGGIEADADGGDCVAITGAKYMGSADANGNVEIRYNI